MEIPQNASQQEYLNEDYLKKQYLKLAKVYHPDAQGSSGKFQELQEAYTRLKAESKGFTLTDEDLFEMYERQTKGQSQTQQQNDQQYYAGGYQSQDTQQNHYESDNQAKERFEQWKKSRFTSYDQASHDEFLRARYHKTFYKYANATQDKQQAAKQNQDFEQSFNAKSHFSNVGAQRVYPHVSQQQNSWQKNPQSNNNSFGFRHNSKFLAFFTNRPFRTKLLDYYHDEIYLQEIKIIYYLSGILIVGIFFNVGLYYYLQMRKRVRRNEQLHDIMESNAKIGKIYVDQKFVFDNEVSMDQLQNMFDQPGKFVISNHLRNKVLKERSKTDQFLKD